MVTVTFTRANGAEMEKMMPAPVLVRKFRTLAANRSWTITSEEESELGEIQAAEDLAELHDLLPKLRKLAATVVAVGFVMLKLHLVRPDLILFPINWPVFA